MRRPIPNWTKIEVRPELELLLACARLDAGEKEAQRIRELLSGDLNWSKVLATAIQHKLFPVLYQRLHEDGLDLIAKDQWELMTLAARQLAKNGLILLAEMFNVHDRFQEQRIPAVPYKGPVLAQLVYRTVGRRHFSDLDFAIPQSYIPQATTLLQAAGYRALFDLKEAHAGQRGYAPGQYSFLLSDRRVQVELHTERTLRYFPCPLDFEEMRARLIEVEIGQRTVRTFSVEDTLVMLCVHGAKHFWERLAWIHDIAALITVQPVNWPLTLQIAEELKSRRLLFLGLYLARELFGAQVPHPFFESAQRDTGVRWLARKVYRQLAGIADPSTGVMRRAAFRLRSADGIGQGLRHTLRLAVSPTESDRQVVRLPDSFCFLYLFVRPWRLLREYGLGLGRRLKPDLPMFEPTPQEIVDRMLRLAAVSPGDALYDSGCGDGRIVATAAEKYGPPEGGRPADEREAQAVQHLGKPAT